MGEYYGTDFSPNDWRLYHHGIKGQKWGVRNGPPYPLKPSAKSYSEKQEGILATVGVILAANAAVYAVGFGIAVSAYEILKAKQKRFIKKCNEERENAEIDEKTGLRLKSTELTQKEDAIRTNPEYLLDTDGGTTNNCTNCTVAYEMRRRGYEVQAQLKTSGRDGEKFCKDVFGAKNATKINPYPDPKKSEEEFHKFFDKYEPLANYGNNTKMAKETIATMKKEPPGSRGQVCLTWNRYVGHSMAYEITSDGKVNFIDGQTGKIHSESSSEMMLRSAVCARYQRLDNCNNVNIKKLKKEAVR